jgi:RND superfamily putative drug exporter
MVQARSAALGASLAALLAAVATLIAMPPLIALYGAGPARRESEAGEVPRWRRLARTMLVRPRTSIAAGVISAVVLLIVAVPVLRGETVALGASALPGGSDARRAQDRATSELPPGVTAPALVAGAPDRVSDAVRLRDDLRRLDGVASAERPQRAGPDLKLIRADPDATPQSLDARGAVRRIRATPAPYETKVGGQDAAALDANDTLFDRLPLAALAAALLAGALLWRLVARPAALSASLAAGALLPAAAAAGLLIFVFQDDRLTGPLDYGAQGAVQLGALLPLLAALVPISAARGTLLAATCAERRSAGPEPAVRRALSLTLPAAAAASLVGLAAGAALAASGLIPLKELGLGVAAGLLLDLVLVRGFLAPSLARLIPAGQP